ncbi:MAG: type II toxin-antitoxin system prevent-host-death family antitoxin [Jatrophihabitantaceae bacterium]
MSDLRANLSEWLRRAQEGDEVVVTERGVPVARSLGIGTSSPLRSGTMTSTGPDSSRQPEVGTSSGAPHGRSS